MNIQVDAARYEAASRFPAYLELVDKHAELWKGMYRTAAPSAADVERLRGIPGEWHFLALSEGRRNREAPVPRRMSQEMWTGGFAALRQSQYNPNSRRSTGIGC